MRALLALLLLCAAFPAVAQHAARDKEWIAHCVSQVSETNKMRARLYCRCMAKSVDTSVKRGQTELERSFPPAHRLCFKKAGFKRPN